MNRKRLFSTIALLFAALTIVLLTGRPDSDTASASPIGANWNLKQTVASGNETFANCRYGATPAADDNGEKTAAISQLGAGWYLSFGHKEPSLPPQNGSDFVHMLFVNQKKDGFEYLPGYDIWPPLNYDLLSYIRKNPGDIWIFGNEVERGPQPGEDDPTKRGQGDTHAEVYAMAYHEAYNFIKHADPTAQVAISGLVQVTPGRLQYLDQVWNSYLLNFGERMPVDVWTMHLYILPEVQPDGTPNGVANIALGTNPELGIRESGGDPANCSDPGVYCFAEHDDIDRFAEQVVAMRQWMANHGEKEKPLLLSEYSLLYPYTVDGATCHVQDEYDNCFTPERIEKFMTKSFNYLNNIAKDPNLGYSLDNNRLIQQYMWWSVYYKGVGEVSNLLKKDLVTLAPLGQNFQNHVTSETPTRNLLIERVDDVIAVMPEEGTATIELSVTFRNNGNTKISQPFTVTFYEDEAQTIPIGSTDITVDVYGCAGRPHEASVEWAGLTEGVHNFWVKVDSDNVIDEVPGDGDNVESGLVRVVERGMYLPVVQSYK